MLEIISSAYRCFVAKKAKKKADEIPAEVAATIEEAVKPAETISKADAVRKALAAGKDQPTEGVAYIKSEFGLDLSTAMFSTYKASEKKKAEGGKPTRQAKDEEPTPSEKPAKGGDTAEFVRQIKDLVNQYGVDTVKRVADVFGK